MTEASKWRLSIARDIAEVYADEPNVKAVLVGGSVGRGNSDTYSDTEFGVFWSELPDKDQQRKIVERIGGTPIGGYNDLAHTEPERGYAPFVIGDTEVDAVGRRTGGYPIELENETVADTEKWLSDVVERFEVSLAKQVLICAIREGVPLYGFKLIEEWRSKTVEYPRELSRKVAKIIVHGIGRKMARQRIWVDRNELLLVGSCANEIIQEIFRLLHGINGEYIADSSKWFQRALAKLEVKPQDIFERLEGVSRAEPREGFASLQTIMEEVVSLIKQHFPEINDADLEWQFSPLEWHEPPAGCARYL